MNTSWSGNRIAFQPNQRKRIIERADGHCQQCGTPTAHLEADHITPIAEGGTHDDTNGQALCRPCHHTKTKAEIKRGQQRWRKRTNQRRPTERHPGLT